MSKKPKKVCTVLQSFENLFWLLGCVSISAFASLVGINISVTSSVIGLKICAITAGIRKYKLIIKKKKKKHDKGFT